MRHLVKSHHRVAIIGCGRPGTGQARGHMYGYMRRDCEMVGLVDIVEENALYFRNEFKLDTPIFSDYQSMLDEAKPEVVSICLWPHLHGPAVMAAARAGVRAIHCEKPIAPSWGEANAMARTCAEAGIQLTFNHQRRFGLPFQRARELLRQGAIGRLQRVEASCDNLFDWGTHWFDMMAYYNGDQPAEWVLGQMEWRESRAIYGVPIEKMGLAHVGFKNGVHGLMVTGLGHKNLGAANRLIGTLGTIEVGATGPDGTAEAITLRYRNQETTGWQEVEMDEDLHSAECYPRSINDNLRSLVNGTEPQLSARRALIGTELIFATYESSRRRGLVELPLTQEDSALITLLREADNLPAKSLVS